MLLIAHQVGNYTLLGSTLDDSVGLSYLLPAAQVVCTCAAGTYYLWLVSVPVQSLHEYLAESQAKRQVATEQSCCIL